MTQRIASMMLDLPQPLGPTTPVMLVGRCNVVGSTNDLNPASLIVVRRIGRSTFHGTPARAWGDKALCQTAGAAAMRCGGAIYLKKMLQAADFTRLAPAHRWTGRGCPGPSAHPARHTPCGAA